MALELIFAAIVLHGMGFAEGWSAGRLYSLARRGK